MIKNQLTHKGKHKVPDRMWAMTLPSPGCDLAVMDLPTPAPIGHDVLLKIAACGVCRTDLHIIDGDLPCHRRGLVPGHEAVGYVVSVGRACTRLKIGQRVGVPWLGGSCGKCIYCRDQKENLCDAPVFTGYDRDGGFAEFALADERYCFKIPDSYDDAHAAPLLCAGLIGFRAYRMCDPDKAQRIGIYGFGAAAHIVCQLAVAQGKRVFAMVRPGDDRSAQFALKMGACWAGPSTECAPEPLDAALNFAPVGDLVPLALRAVRKGGRVVCAGIHMSKIPAFDYSLLWGERSILSVANLTRLDGELFFAHITKFPVETHVQTFFLSEANAAVAAVRTGALDGAAVLVP